MSTSPTSHWFDANAGGKVILAGEHAVVYGSPALAVGLSRGVTARARSGDEARLLLGGKEADHTSESFQAYRALGEALGGFVGEVHVESGMPHGVGLGASAAIAVAIGRAIRQAQGYEHWQEDPAVLSGAHAWEQVFHGNASGVDAACAFHGGVIQFQREAGFKPVTLGASLELAVAVAGPASPTKEMVSLVAKQRKRKAELFESVQTAIAAIVRNEALALQAGDLETVGKLMDHNHMLLSSWMLSTPELETCRELARNAGALGSKLTGAGGGGCVVSLCAPGQSKTVLDAWHGKGFACFAERVTPPVS